MTESVEDLAYIAQRLFVRASDAAPASVTAQAAYIAEAMLKSEYDIDTLKRVLLNSRGRLEEIRKAAEMRHSQSGKGPTILSLGRVLDIVEFDFNHAKKFAGLNADTLRRIYTEMYQESEAKSRAEANGLLAEDHLRLAASNLLNEIH